MLFQTFHTMTMHCRCTLFNVAHFGTNIKTSFFSGCLENYVFDSFMKKKRHSFRNGISTVFISIASNAIFLHDISYKIFNVFLLHLGRELTVISRLCVSLAVYQTKLTFNIALYFNLTLNALE